MAADLAASTCQWLHLIERFDHEEGWAKAGLPSCAAWLSWTCSVSSATAREYVRVARALPLLPLVDEAFAAGRLSYSKVRVLIPVAAEVDEAVLLEQAQVQTVSQLQRTVRAYRRTDAWTQERERRASWHWDDDGMLVLSARLPADEGAIVLAALERARDTIVPADVDAADENADAAADADNADAANADAAADADNADAADAADAVPANVDAADADRRRTALTGADPADVARADMLVALAQRALAAGEVDSSGDDRHLLVLHADFEQLTGEVSEPEGRTEASEKTASLPGDTVIPAPIPAPRCHLEDGPGLRRDTARRIACDAARVTVFHEVGEGEPLRLGRKTRAISPAQRRALRVRDGGCRFPGCYRRTHLEAHHVRHWSQGGATDLENLVLTCRFHHMLVHEGGYRVRSVDGGGWEFRDPYDAPVLPAPTLPGSDTAGSGTAGTSLARAADPMGLLPAWAGEPFHLAETVAVLATSPRGGVS